MGEHLVKRTLERNVEWLTSHAVNASGWFFAHTAQCPHHVGEPHQGNCIIEEPETHTDEGA